jgi:sugar lactone lactonase YvrE
MGESPRWHDGRLWFSDWGAQEIIAVDPEGRSEVTRRVAFALPFSFDWLADGADGICMDADGAVWYADVPNKRCVRVREGGEVLEKIQLDRGGFACMLGAPSPHAGWP